MTIKYFQAGATSIVASARGTMHTIPPQLENIPGGLYPLKMAVWNTDEYRIANGWPVPVPTYDIRAKAVVSAQGEVIESREDPRSVITGATVRWVSDSDTYDETELTWYPIQGESLVWETAPNYAPTFITEYEYLVNNEIFLQDALNFDSDSFEHMWANVDPVLGGGNSYTVIMVGAMNSVYGNNLTVPYSGLWCPGQPTPAPGEVMAEDPVDGWVSLTLQGNTLYLESDQSARKPALGISHLVSATQPFIVAMVVSRPTTTLYAGVGPSSIITSSVNIGKDVKPMEGQVVLGRTNGDILHTADMALMDLGFYSDVLTATQIKSEFSTLSAIYGGDK